MRRVRLQDLHQLTTIRVRQVLVQFVKQVRDVPATHSNQTALVPDGYGRTDAVMYSYLIAIVTVM